MGCCHGCQKITGAKEMGKRGSHCGGMFERCLAGKNAATSWNYKADMSVPFAVVSV